MHETAARFWDHLIANEMLRQYAVALAILTASTAFLMISKRLGVLHLRRAAQATGAEFPAVVERILSQIGAFTVIALSVYLSSLTLTLQAPLVRAIQYVVTAILTVRAVLVAQEIIRYGVRKAYVRSKPGDLLAETMAKNLSKVLGAAVWALGVIFILDNFGVNISALVAGLGIGGIAVAMASQAILGDLFSAVSLFIDKPFEVGDFIIVDDHMGTVEYIGLKTTRIRSLSGEQLVLSNSDLTKSRIKNYKRMFERRVAIKIGVTYETPIDRARRIPQIAADILSGMKGVRFDRAHFFQFGDYALIYEIVYYVLSPDYNLYMDLQQELNFALWEAFRREGIEFAYPTQTLRVDLKKT